jgi:hypothetical protein
MDGAAIRRVTEALQEALRPAIGNAYVGPLDDPDASEEPAVLFLYRVSINADLRSAEHPVPPQLAGGPSVLHQGSLPLDLRYLLTTGKAGKRGELDALALLGRAMQALQDRPELVGVNLQGETVRVTPDPVSTEEMSRIWTLFPTVNYRTSVAYLATPVWIDPARPPVEGAPVTRETYRVGHLQTSITP